VTAATVSSNDPTNPVGRLTLRIVMMLTMLWYQLTHRFRESNIEKHARREMVLAGLYDQDADYGAGAIANEVMKLCKVLGRGGHSGGSHGMVMGIFNEVANFRPLTPITTDPNEWMNVSEYSLVPDGTRGVWQNRRKSTCFSTDGGITHYDIDEPGRPIHETLPWQKVRHNGTPLG
jgi:hypothetical protein